MSLQLRRRLATLATAIMLGVSPVPIEPTTDSCPPGSGVGLDDYVVWVDGGGGFADVPLRAALACDISRTIRYRTFDLSARAGEDYVGVLSGSVTLPAGSTATVVRIQVYGKQLPQPDETFGVLLTSGATFTDPEAIVTIKATR